jgi:hypothetical protein
LTSVRPLRIVPRGTAGCTLLAATAPGLGTRWWRTGVRAIALPGEALVGVFVVGLSVGAGSWMSFCSASQAGVIGE